MHTLPSLLLHRVAIVRCPSFVAHLCTYALRRVLTVDHRETVGKHGVRLGRDR